MDEIVPPSPEKRRYISEDLSIPGNPDVPGSSENHFSKEWLTKFSPCFASHLVGSHTRCRIPGNLQIVPNSLAEYAGEEKMADIFMYMMRT